MGYNPRTGRFEVGYSGPQTVTTSTKTAPRSVSTKYRNRAEFEAKKPSRRYKNRAEFEAKKPKSPSVAAPRNNIGYSSGYNGGFGNYGGSTAPARAQDSSRLAELRAARLEAALSAIAAQFDTEEGDLNKQLGDLSTLFDRTLAENSRVGEQRLEGISDQAANRGILRSGIFAQNTAEELGLQAEQEGDLRGRISNVEGAEGTEVRAIQSALKLLAQEEASAVASAELESEQSELDVEQMIALITAGLQ